MWKEERIKLQLATVQAFVYKRSVFVFAFTALMKAGSFIRATLQCHIKVKQIYIYSYEKYVAIATQDEKTN